MASEPCGPSSSHPGRPDEAYLAVYRRLRERVLRRIWPTTFSGVENLPEGNGYLVVANHSGMGIAECLVLFGDWIDHAGPDRPLAAMVHSTSIGSTLGGLLRAAGTVEATREGAAWARRKGSALLVFPGGDHEATRPMWRARQVDFANRRGWIRLARELDLDIVPLAITGSHRTLPMLGSSKLLATLLGARAIGMKRLPVPMLSVASGLLSWKLTRRWRLPARAAAFVAAYAATFFVPFVPSRIGFHVLPPIPRSELDGDEGEIYERVTAAIGDVLSRA